MAKTKKTTRIQWLLSGMGDAYAHTMLGRTLGSGDMSDTERLHEKAIHGEHDAWDADKFTFDYARNIYIEAHKLGLCVKLFKRVLDGTS
jgi:hypothetical protein